MPREKSLKGKVINVKPVIKKGRLKITGRIETGESGCIEAILPAREMAALLPRHIILGETRKASIKLLETIRSIAARFIMGRKVRVWKYNETCYFSFIAWTDVLFTDSCPDDTVKAPQH